MQAALGIGSQDGETSSMNIDQMKEMFRKMKSSRHLHQILERAGAWRRAARAAQQRKTSHGYDDMVGTEMSGDIGRILATELAQLGDEDLEPEILRRIAEHQALSYQYEGVEDKSKGPIVVCVDESGSMGGQRIVEAKAMALAMAWIAKSQNRFCALVSFSASADGRLCVLRPGHWDQNALMQWLGDFIGGGTTCRVPLATVPFKYWDNEISAPKGKTDMFILTDGYLEVSTGKRDAFNEWKEQEQVRCTTIGIGTGAEPLQEVSNEVHCVNSLSVDSDAAKSCLSV